jgi:two-component system NtrC family sensor kinase
MTLRRKMGYQIAAMIVGLLLVSAASLWGLNGLQQDYREALEGYQRLRQVYQAGTHLATARKMLDLQHPSSMALAADEVSAAAIALDQLKPGQGWNDSAEQSLRRGVRDLKQRLREAPQDAPSPQFAEARLDEVNALLGRIPELAADIRQRTQASRHDAQAKKRATIVAVAVTCGAVVIGSIVIGVLQYRGVTGPLGRLSEGVRKLGAGQFAGRVEPRPRWGEEFVSLSGDFNRMAAELDGFYRELEQKVAAKSKELIRSERLASVGFLAAGVAHEINNPLGIISGYAEYSLSELRERSRQDGSRVKVTTDGAAPGAGDGLSFTEVEKSLQVIRDEAFRCKEITGKLLSLARPGDDARKPVSLTDVARDVAAVVGGLKEFRDRKLVVKADGRAGEPAAVLAVEGEMKQVLLNLTLNALEAVAPGDGEVRIEVARRDAWVELSVTDNGRGMTPQTLEHVFEPFFTEKKGAGPRHGTGLGLSITHAIVQSHGGTIEAHSDGPGKGSRFVVRLPAS